MGESVSARQVRSSQMRQSLNSQPQFTTMRKFNINVKGWVEYLILQGRASVGARLFKSIPLLACNL